MVINSEQAISIPQKENNTLKFQNFHKQMPVPFAIYADFEAITEKISGSQPNNTQSYTESYQKHTGYSYGYKVVCFYNDQYTKPAQIYRGEKPNQEVYGRDAKRGPVLPKDHCYQIQEAIEDD